MIANGKGQRTVTFLVGLLGLVVLGTACTAKLQSLVRDTRLAPTGIAPDQSVAIVLSEFSGAFSQAKEDEFVGCINEAIRNARPTVRIVPPDEFRRVGLPDLTPKEFTPRPWEQLVEEPTFRDQIAPLGIRYLILLRGWTEERWGPPPRGISPVSIDRGHRQSWLKAVIWDFIQARRAGEVTVEVSGRPQFWMFFPFIPVVIPAFTETRACRELGEAVAQFLAGDSPPEPHEGIELQNQ